jgi:hypothetical protein
MRKSAFLFSTTVLIGLLTVGGSRVDGAAPSNLTFIVTRQLRNGYGMFGKLQIEGQSPSEFVCYTLERRNGAIPENTYRTSLRLTPTSESFGAPPTPSQPYIRLRAGATEADSDGSILVGTNFVTEKVQGRNKTTALSGGKAAIAKLKAIFYPDNPSEYTAVPVTVKVVKSPNFREHE